MLVRDNEGDKEFFLNDRAKKCQIGNQMLMYHFCKYLFLSPLSFKRELGNLGL